jgi:hypothetical protein
LIDAKFRLLNFKFWIIVEVATKRVECADNVITELNPNCNVEFLTFFDENAIVLSLLEHILDDNLIKVKPFISIAMLNDLLLSMYDLLIL